MAAKRDRLMKVEEMRHDDTLVIITAQDQEDGEANAIGSNNTSQQSRM